MGSLINEKYSRSCLEALYKNLLMRTLAGDRDSFGEAAELISPQLLRRALAILDCTASAQDAVQEALLIAYQQLSTLRDLNKFSSWMNSIVESQCFRIIRQRKKEIHLPTFLEERLLAPKRQNPENAYEHLCFNAAFDQALTKLSPAQQLTSNLYYREGYSIAEIADRLGLHSGTVKKRIHDAKPMLAKTLNGFAGKKVLKVGFLPISDHLLGMMAQRLHTSSKSQVQIQRFLSWQALTESLRHGHIDAAFIMAPLAIRLLLSGTPLFYILDAHHDGSSLATSSKSLQGKKIGIPDHFSTHKALLHPLAKQFNLVPGDINTININPSYVIRSMHNHLIDGFFCAEPWGTKCENEGSAKIIIRSNSISPGHPCCILVVRQEFAVEHGALVKTFVQTLLKARDRLITDPQFGAEAQAHYTGIDPQLALKVIEEGHVTFNDLNPDSDRLLDFMTLTMNSGVFPSDCDLQKFVCSDYC